MPGRRQTAHCFSIHSQQQLSLSAHWDCLVQEPGAWSPMGEGHCCKAPVIYLGIGENFSPDNSLLALWNYYQVFKLKNPSEVL